MELKQVLRGQFHQIGSNTRSSSRSLPSYKPFRSKHIFELKNWLSNRIMVSGAIPKVLRFFSNTKRVVFEPNTEGSEFFDCKSQLLMLFLTYADEDSVSCFPKLNVVRQSKSELRHDIY